MYVLIFVLAVGTNGQTKINQEYTSQTACEAAKTNLLLQATHQGSLARVILADCSAK
jgi:hypothetical protein